MKETFKPMIGWPGYFVSDMGRVLSLKRREPAILTICKNRTGYAIVEVYHRKKINFLYVAREVLSTFRGYPAEPWLCVAHHLNGDTMDCRLENLEWVICETTEEYDPTKSKRRGVKKPDFTREKMTEAKLKQSRETIQKAIDSRRNTVEMRRLVKKDIPQGRSSDVEVEDISDVYKVMSRIHGE